MLEPRETLSSVREAISRFFDESYVSPRALEMLVFGRSFPLDISETERDYVVEASLPGVRPEDVKVSALSDTVTIQAIQRHEEATGAPKTYMRRERYEGELKRTITLPTPIDAEHVAASYEHGMLTLRVPKTEAAKPHVIPVEIPKMIEKKEVSAVH